MLRFSPCFPSEFQVQLRESICRYIEDVAARNGPLRLEGTVNLRAIPGVLAEALQAALALTPATKARRPCNVTSPLRLEPHRMRGGSVSS